jgi:hypothetical protein
VGPCIKDEGRVSAEAPRISERVPSRDVGRSDAVVARDAEKRFPSRHPMLGSLAVPDGDLGAGLESREVGIAVQLGEVRDRDSKSLGHQRERLSLDEGAWHSNQLSRGATGPS